MKTTVNLNDKLLTRAQNFAKRKGITFTAVLEDSLQSYISAKTRHNAKPQPIKIKPFGKGGYIDPTLEGDWPRLRNLIYEK